MPSKMSSTNQLGKNWRSNSGLIHVFPCQNDLDDWKSYQNVEKDLVGKVFGGLTLLDTMQSETGVQAPSRGHPYTTWGKLFSITSNLWNLFTLNLTHQSSLPWILRLRLKKFSNGPIPILTYKESWDCQRNLPKRKPTWKKVASVFLETFLFYSGFFTPLYYLGN